MHGNQLFSGDSGIWLSSLGQASATGTVLGISKWGPPDIPKYSSPVASTSPQPLQLLAGAAGVRSVTVGVASEFDVANRFSSRASSSLRLSRLIGNRSPSVGSVGSVGSTEALLLLLRTPHRTAPRCADRSSGGALQCC